MREFELGLIVDRIEPSLPGTGRIADAERATNPLCSRQPRLTQDAVTLPLIC
jgi:hypothetical protein